VRGLVADDWRVLTRFVAREGHARVPTRYTEDGYRLGAWMDQQRANKRAGRLSDERAARLEALVGWDWDPRLNRAAASR
jgi:hypothetical protein